MKILQEFILKPVINEGINIVCLGNGFNSVNLQYWKDLNYKLITVQFSLVANDLIYMILIYAVKLTNWSLGGV